MNKLVFDDEKIEFIIEKKKLFSKNLKTIVNTIKITDIKSASCEMYNKKLNSSTIMIKDGTQEFIVSEELEEPQKLTELLEFLDSKGVKIEYINLDDIV